MDLNAEVEQTQRELADLKARLDAFEAESKATIEIDHTIMLTELQKSVDSVEGTLRYLDTGSSCLAGYLECNPAVSKNELSKALVQEHLADMDSKFSVVQAAASSGLDRIEHIKKTCDDMHDELGTIRSNLESLTMRTWRTWKRSSETVMEKQQEATKAKSSLESTQQQLRTLEAKMSNETDARDVMRVARVASWGLGLFFPPMLLAAGGLEAAAAAMRKDRKDLQNLINSASTRYSSLSSEVATVERQAATLDEVATAARSLWCRSEDIDTRSNDMKTLICDRLEEYQALKSSTDDFGAWTRDLQTQTETAQTVGVSSKKLLQRTTKQIVEALLDKKQDDVVAICNKLKYLEVGS